MTNLLITVVILSLTFGRNVSIRTVSTREAATVCNNSSEVTLLVRFYEKCRGDKGITNDIIDHVIRICNCIVIDNSVECCNGDHAVYKLILSQELTVTKFDYHSVQVMIEQCCYGNCTCDIKSESSSSNEQMMLILVIACGCLLLLVLLTISVICYKCYRLCHRREKVISMIPCPAPLPFANNSNRQCLPLQQLQLQHVQRVTIGSSEYIEPSEILSPTSPPALHHSDNRSCIPIATMMEQSVTVDVQLETVDVQSPANNMQFTISNMESIADTPITQQKAHNGGSNGYVDHSIAREHQQPMISSSHGKITTPSGLVATIKVPTTVTEDAGISEYIEPSEILSPTSPPAVHHSDNRPCNKLPSANIMEQSPPVGVTVDVQSPANNMQPTISNMETNTSITQQKAHNGGSNGYVDHTTAREHQQSMISSLHGKITTPTGLVATIKVPTTLIEAASIMSPELTKQPTANGQSTVDMQPVAIGNTESIGKCLLITQQ